MAIPQIIPADIAGSMQRGWLFGEQQKQARRQEQEYERKRGDLAALRNLAPSVLQGNLADYQRAAAIDPEAAAAYQDAGDRGLRRATNVVKIMETALASKDDAAVQAAHRRVAPYLQELTGQTPPEQWDASMLPNFQAFADRVKAANSPLVNKNIPSGYQEFALMAEAAGLKPGDDDYAKAAGVRLGINARPPTGGFSFDTVDFGDGRKRPARMNPRTGTQEYYDERVGRWLQLGDGGSLDNGATSGGVNVGSGDSEVVVNIPEISQDRQRQLANVASAMRANGVSDDAINRWISSVLNTDVSDRPTPPAPAQPQPYQQPAPTSSFANSGQSPARAPVGVGASRTPEEEAAAVEQAKTDVNLANATRVTDMEADRAGQIEAQKREAQRIAENRAGLAKTESTITQMQNLVGQAKRHRGRSTATVCRERWTRATTSPAPTPETSRCCLTKSRAKRSSRRLTASRAAAKSPKWRAGRPRTPLGDSTRRRVTRSLSAPSMTWKTCFRWLWSAPGVACRPLPLTVAVPGRLLARERPDAHPYRTGPRWHGVRG